MLPSRLFFDDSFFKGEETVKCDVFEKDGKIFVEMEAPGYTKDDISLSIDKGELSVTFEKENEKEENKSNIFTVSVNITDSDEFNKFYELFTNISLDIKRHPRLARMPFLAFSIFLPVELLSGRPRGGGW